MKNGHRQYGTIRSYSEDEERGPTCWIFIDLKDGGTQGFGGYVLNEHREAWVREICQLFGVSKPEDLVGKHCWVLRCFSGWNETIEGLEASDGKRFTATNFFRGRLPEGVKSRLERARESALSTIACATRRINDETQRLAGLEADFVDWATRSEGTDRG